MPIIPMMLLGIVIALIRRSSNAVTESPRADAPMRLLRWATGLLSAQRAEWGQAMLGELDHIEGRLRCGPTRRASLDPTRRAAPIGGRWPIAGAAWAHPLAGFR